MQISLESIALVQGNQGLSLSLLKLIALRLSSLKPQIFKKVLVVLGPL